MIDLASVVTCILTLLAVLYVMDVPSPFRKPPAKPRRYRIRIENEDGWPLESHEVSSEAVGRVLRDLEREKGR